jgi:hypothetical protein
MVNACEKGTFTGDRDIAILLCLMDTGARANEFLNIDLENQPGNWGYSHPEREG